MNEKLTKDCPFREGSASHAIYMSVARAKEPLAVAEVCKRAKVPEKKVRLLLAAYQNPFHNAPLRRVGIAIVRKGEGFALEACKAEPNAHRPERGAGKKAKKSPGKKKAGKKAAKAGEKKHSQKPKHQKKPSEKEHKPAELHVEVPKATNPETPVAQTDSPEAAL